MKKLNKGLWERYKESTYYKQTVADFENLLNATPKEVAEIILKYNDNELKNRNQKQAKERFNIIEPMLSDIEVLRKEGDYKDHPYDVFAYFITMWASEGEEWDLDSLKKSDFKDIIRGIPMVSIAMYKTFPDVFIPYLYDMRFNLLQYFADTYDIELPPIPARANYKDRCLYYIKICDILHTFRLENELTPAELCALLYDYIPSTAEQEETEPYGKYHNVWILCGNKWGKEKKSDNMFWQASPDTRKGDVMIFYEKSPIKAITGVWRSKADGMIDPFFHYYGFTYIGDEIQIPHITADEMKTDKHFKEVNFVRKNFQDVSGWQVTHKDYDLLLQMLAAKGFDTSTLPRPFIPPINDWSKVLEKGKKIKEIADVEERIIIPFLTSLGLVKGKDYERQVTLHLGHDDKGRTDFSLFPFGDTKHAHVVIETKRKQDNVLQDTFNQARSYADLQQADLLLIIDEQEVNAYIRNKDKLFNFQQRQTFYWYDILNDADIYSTFVKLLFSYK